MSLSVDLLAPEGYGESSAAGSVSTTSNCWCSASRSTTCPQEAFEWYLDLRRYGRCAHGGFGMGIERVVTWICGIDHLREAIPYPRMIYRMYP